jgi:L-aspartate oxidase
VESGGATRGRAKPSPISAASREALWRHAGLERDAAGLRELTADPHPLVRLIAECALARIESRGAHQRSDFPERDPAFDGRHETIGAAGDPVLQTWT